MGGIIKGMSQKALLKDILFNRSKVIQIAGEIQRVYPSFKKDGFVRDVTAKFPELELKARISWITDCLKNYLPSEFQKATGILLRALPAPNDPNLSDNDFGDFIYAPYAEYVAKNGCNKIGLLFSLSALKKITARFSAEDAIRRFINAFPQETLKELLEWSKDEHYHVRRLCSEGTRPKLPWSKKINTPITAPLSMLDNLFSDRTRFVTRSVANHINDISKIDPDLAVETLNKWRKSGRQEPQEMDYIVRHSLRTLVKQGNPKAMQLLGVSHAKRVSVANFKVPKKIKMNTALEFSFDIEAQEDTEIIADYIIYFQNKSGKLNSKKVFKLKKFFLKRNGQIAIVKRHPLRQFMTTRALYPGHHEIEIQINGKSYGKAAFELK